MNGDIEPVRQSLLGWIFSSLGFPLLVILLMAGLLSFFVAFAIVLRGRGPMAVASLLLVVHVPLLIGIYAAIRGATNAYMVIATSSTTPKPSELAVGISSALIAPTVGMILMTPGYAVALVGTFVRAMASSPKSSESA